MEMMSWKKSRKQIDKETNCFDIKKMDGRRRRKRRESEKDRENKGVFWGLVLKIRLQVERTLI